MKFVFRDPDGMPNLDRFNLVYARWKRMIERRADAWDDPPAPRWLIRFCVGMTVFCLLTYVDALYRGRWGWAGLDALCVLVNANNAYFNTLPVSQRVRLLKSFGACHPQGEGEIRCMTLH